METPPPPPPPPGGGGGGGGGHADSESGAGAGDEKRERWNPPPSLPHKGGGFVRRGRLEVHAIATGRNQLGRTVHPVRRRANGVSELHRSETVGDGRADV